MNNTIVRKKIERVKRGQLTDFYHLIPIVQYYFQRIKEELKDRGIDEVYVFGSYFWGTYHDESDYDVIAITDTPVNVDEFREEFKSKYDVRADVISRTEPPHPNMIKIP